MTDPAPTMPALAEEALWDAYDVAAYLKLSVWWVRKRVAAGKIPFLRVGGHAIRFDPEKIKTWARTGGGAKVLAFKG